MRTVSFSTGAALVLWFALGVATAQTPPPRTIATKIWDIKPGTAVSALPLDQFVDPACGTNGGPPSKVLPSFADFAQCGIERGSGLREVWFRYDDEMEYVARARRSELMIRQHRANSLAGQPIITSLLIDDNGLVQGYRIVNDPRTDAQTRIAAFGLADVFKGVAGLGLTCTDLPLAEGERPIEDWYIKQVCEKVVDGRVTRIEARRYYKPGQFAVGPNDNQLTENLFESSARLEVYRAAAR